MADHLTDDRLRSVIHMAVRNKDCFQAYEGGRAVRNWFEGQMRQGKIITSEHRKLLAIMKDLVDSAEELCNIEEGWKDMSPQWQAKAARMRDQIIPMVKKIEIK